MRFLLSIAVLAGVWTVSAQGTFEAIIGHENTPPVSELVTTTVGWTFQPTSFVAVTDLGCFSYLFASPFVNEIQVGLWNTGGVLLASSLIKRSSALTNESSYVSINPVPLDPNQTYHIGAWSLDELSVEICGGGAGGTNFMGAYLRLGAAAKSTVPAGLSFPLEMAGTGGAAYLAPNFRYDDRVPEPASAFLLGLGALIVAARCRRQRL